MSRHSARMAARDPRDPLVHELSSFRYDGAEIAVSLHVRCDERGTWRGRLSFQAASAETDPRTTAEIFCAQTERDVWSAAQRLGEFHVRDLYRSVL